MKVYTQRQKNLRPFNVWQYFRQKFVIFADFKQISFFFFWFSKTLVKGYFRAKFQLPTVPLSKFIIFTFPTIHRMSIKSPFRIELKLAEQCKISLDEEKIIKLIKEVFEEEFKRQEVKITKIILSSNFTLKVH